MKLKVYSCQTSPTRGTDGKPIPDDSQHVAIARSRYKLDVEEATKELMEFISRVLPEKRISIMYFDEAHELRSHLWIFLRLVQHQSLLTRMWYSFMGTKSNLSYYVPPPRKRQSAPSLACTCLIGAIVLSLRLRQELTRLSMPYIDLGFDQRAIAKSGAVSVRMGDMETIEFISQYGRPMCVDLAGKSQLLISLPDGVHICQKQQRAS